MTVGLTIALFAALLGASESRVSTIVPGYGRCALGCWSSRLALDDQSSTFRTSHSDPVTPAVATPAQYPCDINSGCGETWGCLYPRRVALAEKLPTVTSFQKHLLPMLMVIYPPYTAGTSLLIVGFASGNHEYRNGGAILLGATFVTASIWAIFERENVKDIDRVFRVDESIRQDVDRIDQQLSDLRPTSIARPCANGSK